MENMHTDVRVESVKTIGNISKHDKLNDKSGLLVDSARNASSQVAFGNTCS